MHHVLWWQRMCVSVHGCVHWMRVCHIWQQSSAQFGPVEFREGTAVAGDLLHLSVESCWALSLFIASWIQECAAEQRTWSAFRLSQGVNYDFPSKAEPRETAWTVIHQPGCLHPPEQCVTPGPIEGQKTGDFHLLAHTRISQIYTNMSHLHTPLCLV